MATLKEFAQSEVERLTKTQKKTSEDLTKAQKDLKLKQEAHGKATRELQQLDQQIAEKRQAMAGAGQMPPDLQSLVDKLTDLIKQRRVKRPAQLEAERTLDRARADVDAAQAQFQAATEGLRAAQSAFKAVDEQDKRRQAWKQAVSTEPLKNVPADAQAVPNTSPGKEAWDGVQKWLGDNLPEEIRVRAAQRRGFVLNVLGLKKEMVRHAQDLLGNHAQQGLEAEVAKLRTTFNQTEAASAAYVDSARQRLGQALDLLKQVQGAPALTPEVKKWIYDEERRKNAKTAIEKEKARDDADLDVKKSEAQLEKKRIEIRATDVDANPSGDPDVQKLQDELNKAKDTLQKAQGELDAVHADLEAVEAVIPDSAWEALVAFETAQSLLQDLAQTQPNDLVTSMDDAEAKLCAGLQEQVDARRSLDDLSQSSGQAAGDFEQFRRTQDRRVLSAVCGDL